MANVTASDPSNDITKEVGSMQTLFQVSSTDFSDAVTAVYDAAKNEFAELIDSSLPDIYARFPFQGWPYNQWLQFLGYSYLQTDELRELIRPLQIAGVDGQYTPDQITTAIAAHKAITIQTITTTFAALFIKRAYTRMQSQWKSSANSGARPHDGDIILWTEEAKCRWRECKKRLFIDFSKSGQVIDTERTRTRVRRFTRG